MKYFEFIVVVLLNYAVVWIICQLVPTWNPNFGIILACSALLTALEAKYKK